MINKISNIANVVFNIQIILMLVLFIAMVSFDSIKRLERYKKVQKGIDKVYNYNLYGFWFTIFVRAACIDYKNPYMWMFFAMFLVMSLISKLNDKIIKDLKENRRKHLSEAGRRNYQIMILKSYIRHNLSIPESVKAELEDRRWFEIKEDGDDC